MDNAGGCVFLSKRDVETEQKVLFAVGFEKITLFIKDGMIGDKTRFGEAYIYNQSARIWQ